jgi:predicted dehydrogenase
VGCDRRSYQIFEIDILGTEGRLRIESNGYLATLWGVGASDQDSEDGTLEFRRIVHDDDEGRRMVDALSDILRCVEHGGQPYCDGSDGRAALEVTTAFLKGLSSGRKVSLPLRGRDLHREAPFREVVFKRAEGLVPLLR